MTIQVQNLNCCPGRFVCVHKMTLLIILIISAAVTVIDQLYQKLPYDEQTRYIVSTIIDGINATIISVMAIFGLNNLNRVKYSKLDENGVYSQEMMTMNVRSDVANNKELKKRKNDEVDEERGLYPNIKLTEPTAPLIHNYMYDHKTQQAYLLTEHQMEQIKQNSVDTNNTPKIEVRSQF
uniref:Banna VP11 n=1 Tax=Banna virus TaxID=77763 RepID=A0A1L3KP67_BANNV|nr:Banna VP11 [Banna virus]